MLIDMGALSSRGSRGKAPAVDGDAYWRRNSCFLPPWHERPKCRCHRPCIIDVWEYDGTKQARRRYFKCVDTDSTLWYGVNLYALFKFYAFVYIQ
jgi:hypothetical protein